MKTLLRKILDKLLKDELPDDVSFGLGRINGNHNKQNPE